ncbi:MAG: hypothetical protein AAFO94_16165 [Bacteroidota bacterium]
MKQNRIPLLSLLICLFGLTQLQAQEDAIIRQFNMKNIVNEDIVADSLLYQPQGDPIGGPVDFRDDTLFVYSPDGTLDLNFDSMQDSVFVKLWLDSNNDGVFDEDEVLISSVAKKGDDPIAFNLPQIFGTNDF